MYLQKRNKLTNLEKELTVAGEGWREGVVREFGIDMYIVIYLKWITSKDLLNNTWNSAQCYMAARMGGEFGGEWIHVCV